MGLREAIEMEEKIHPHEEEIRTWLECYGECEVWFRTGIGRKWEQTLSPSWNKNYAYRIVPDAYADAWRAYLDGELQVKSSADVWGNWETTSLPNFSQPPDHYRRKPKEPENPVIETNELRPGWIAKDPCGRVCWYNELPSKELSINSWVPITNGFLSNITHHPIAAQLDGVHWEESLRQIVPVDTFPFNP